MNNCIQAINNLRVSDFLGEEVEANEDLLLSKDIKVQKFIEKYKKYLFSFDSNDIRKFYELTGLFIVHSCSTNNYRNGINKIVITHKRYLCR